MSQAFASVKRIRYGSMKSAISQDSGLVLESPKTWAFPALTMIGFFDILRNNPDNCLFLTFDINY